MKRYLELLISGVVGGVAALLLSGGLSFGAESGAVQKVVRAERFEVVDEAGTIRVVLGMEADSPTRAERFEMVDSGGRTRMVLVVDRTDSFPRLGLYDTTGEPRVILGDLDGAGTAGLALTDTKGKTRACLEVPPSDAHLPEGATDLSLIDAAGKTRVRLKLDHNGSPALLMGDAHANVIYHAP